VDENFQEITAFFSEYTAQIIFLLPDLFLIEHTVFTIKQTSKSYVLCIVVGLNARGCHMCLALICAKPLFTEKCRYMPLQTAYTTKFPSTKVFLFSQYLFFSQKKKKNCLIIFIFHSAVVMYLLLVFIEFNCCFKFSM
jgi:hypothetical protein